MQKVNPVVAPFWADLYFEDLPTSDLCYKTLGQAPQRRFVVLWKNARRVGRPSVRLSFEVVLHEGSDVVDFVYKTLAATEPDDASFADGTRAAIGIESRRAVRTALHAGAVTTAEGLRFTPTP